MKPQQTIQRVLTQFNNESEKYVPYTSMLEAAASVRQDHDDLWDAIKRGDSKADIAARAKELAAQAMRLMTDCC